MPIRRDLRQFYGREWRTVIRPRILKRAGGRFDKDGNYIGGAHCERCGKPDRKKVFTVTGSHYPIPMIWRPATGPVDWRGPDGKALPFSHYLAPAEARIIRVQIGIAHLNHKPGDDRDDNLAALCGWCHLHHDRKLHVQSARETRMDRKDANRALLQVAV